MASSVCHPPAESSLLRSLHQIWGYDAFRPPQREIVQAILDQRDILAILPTGSGKSICFQLPAILKPGLTLVVSPLVALMENQVRELQDRNVAAALLHSQLSATQRRQVLQQLDRQQLLYLSPETLLSLPVWQRLCNPGLRLNGLVLDEAHCVVQWGSSFRSAYQRLGAVRQALLSQRRSAEPLPIAAFTATADLPTQRSLIQTLQLDRPEIFQQNIYRPNLNLKIETVWTPRQRRNKTLRYVRSKGNQSGLVYVRTRRDSETLAAQLNQKELRTVAYHGGLSDRRRRQIEQDWLSNELKFVICTSAFGLGINKANVRWVLHYQVPLLLSEYVQEIGRGGRDGLEAEALALVSEPTGWFDPSDQTRDRFFLEQLSQHEQTAQQLLPKLATTGSIADVARQFPEAATALALLHHQGKIRWVDPFHYTLTPGSKTALKAAQASQRFATTRQFAIAHQCRWQTLLQSFGCAPLEQDCGHCDICRR
ncbi:MAG: ATP-dependent DNA helicase RecQ [Synechococcales cyanobacterium CRU_2_2]|nr:ATP-dependent DNA helicase RecQ [Synechococcales cyanobacterium CRU_2_2]